MVIAANESDQEATEQEEMEDFSFVARPPSIEMKYMALEDKCSREFRSHCRKMFGLHQSSVLDELSGMQLK